MIITIIIIIIIIIMNMFLFISSSSDVHRGRNSSQTVFNTMILVVVHGLRKGGGREPRGRPRPVLPG